MKHRKPYKTYTREFKQEAVRLMETTDRPAAEVAMELGIRRIQLYKWKQQLAVKGEAAFTGGGRPKTENLSELVLLKRENEQLREENEILKKAAAYFARELKWSTPLSGTPQLLSKVTSIPATRNEPPGSHPR